MSISRMIVPRLPSVVLARTYLLRGVRIWIIARLVVSFLVMLGGGPGAVVRSALTSQGVTVFSVVVMSMLLGALDIRMKKERAFLGNLGVPEITIVLLFAASAAVGELALKLVQILA